MVVPDLPWAGLADLGVPLAPLGELAVAADRRGHAAGAATVEEHPWGQLLRSPAEPTVHDANCALVTSGEADVMQLLDDVDRAAAADGLRHRRVLVDAGDAVATEIVSAATQRWSDVEVSAELVMVAVAPPDRWVEDVDVTIVDDAGFMEFEREVIGRAPWIEEEPGFADQMLRRDARLVAAVDFFGVLSPDASAPVAGCHVYRSGDLAQIETVNVLEEARGRGLGRVIVQAALQEATRRGASGCFLVAEADDWVWRLYARLGFTTARQRIVVRTTSPNAARGPRS